MTIELKALNLAELPLQAESPITTLVGDAVMVSRGVSDLWIETSGKPWDFAPLKIIAEEAGARFFNFEGNPTIYGGNCVICTPGLESVARRFVSQPYLA